MPVVGLLAFASCQQQDDHPPLASDGYDPEPSSEEVDDFKGQPLIDEADEAVNCGETSIELPVKRPNFYFVLDASGSMLDEMPDSGGQTRHWAARQAIVEMLRKVGHRVNYGAAVFPRPNAQSACAAGAEVFALREGDAKPKDDDSETPALDALVFTLRKYSPNGATPISHTLSELREQLTSLGPNTHVFLLTDGAPNCDDDGSCEAGRCIANIEGFSFDDGTKCDDDFNCCSLLDLSHMCLDDDDTLRELSTLRDAGVSTYVIGIPGSEVYAELLDEMARAAGTARLDASTEYFRVQDVAELADTLTQLGTELSLSCDIELEETPKRAQLVRVFADAEQLPPEDPNGWEWLDDNHISLVGKACDQWKSGHWDSITVVEGCDATVR